MEQAINKMFSEAAGELENAEFELNRPIEDVVVFAVCANTNGAIRKMLTAFLAFKALEENQPLTEANLQELARLGTINLFDQCCSRQKAFSSIDTSALQCCHAAPHPDSSAYCLEVDTVRHCAEIGRTVEQTVRQFTSLK